MPRLSFVDTVLGRPLASEEEDQQRLGVLAGIPVFAFGINQPPTAIGERARQVSVFGDPGTRSRES